MIISIHDIWQTAKAQHVAFLTKELAKGLNSLGNSYFDRRIRNFIIDNKSTIIYGDSPNMLLSIEKYEYEFGDHIFRKCANKKLKDIFDFDTFSLKSAKPWTAYQLCKQAKYQTCSYCQLVSTGTSLPDEDAKGYRPPIDHYYAKADYPFLALTLSNFIPCCEKCNGSQMKGVIDFSKTPHLNPLTDEESIIFVLESSDPIEAAAAQTITLNLPKEKYYLALNIVNNPVLSNESIKTFQLKSRYREYSTQAYYLAKKMRGLTARIEMHNESLDFTTSIDDYLEFEHEKYKTVPYGKARLCIANQFGACIK